jgi:thioesterase domain-containing protein
MTSIFLRPGHESLVPLRVSGSGAPLFCFPGSGGNVSIFREMVSTLPEGRPVYAIDMEWLSETRQEFSIEQLAVFCLAVIQKAQQSGPYYLCGYSFGGVVAYEIAMRLIDKGDSANLLAMLDVTNPSLISNLSTLDSMRFRKTYLIDRLKRYGHHLASGDMKAFLERGLAFLTSRTGKFFVPAMKVGYRLMKKPLPEILRSNDPSFLKAWKSYIPQTYPLDLVCFRVDERGPEHDRDPSMGWETCVAGTVHVHIVPGGHVDMMRLPSVRTVANVLAFYLDKSSIPP